jgi:hypothetical protein
MTFGMCRVAALVLVVVVGFVAAPNARTGSARDERLKSTYSSLASERRVGARVTVLSTSLVLQKPAPVLLHSDGVFAPRSADAAARVYVNLDGHQVTNASSIDWRGSAAAVRHSFNSVGAVRLGAGTHKVELVAEAIAGEFAVEQGSNLSVFVSPARRVATSSLNDSAGPFDYRSLDLMGNALPHTRLVSLSADARKPIVALASADTHVAGHDGDSMLGIYLDGRHPGPNRSLWTVNDTCQCAEIEGPVFTHAVLTGGTATSTVSLDASEFPWRSAPPFSQSDNPAVYAVQPTAALTVLSGGLVVVGAGVPGACQVE